MSNTNDDDETILDRIIRIDNRDGVITDKLGRIQRKYTKNVCIPIDPHKRYSITHLANTIDIMKQYEEWPSVSQPHIYVQNIKREKHYFIRIAFQDFTPNKMELLSVLGINNNEYPIDQLVAELNGTQFIFNEMFKLLSEYIDDGLSKWITDKSIIKDFTYKQKTTIYINIEVELQNILVVLAQVYEDIAKINAFFDLYRRQSTDIDTMTKQIETLESLKYDKAGKLISNDVVMAENDEKQNQKQIIHKQKLPQTKTEQTRAITILQKQLKQLKVQHYHVYNPFKEEAYMETYSDKNEPVIIKEKDKIFKKEIRFNKNDKIRKKQHKILDMFGKQFK
eukprot:200099_1